MKRKRIRSTITEADWQWCLDIATARTTRLLAHHAKERVERPLTLAEDILQRAASTFAERMVASALPGGWFATDTERADRGPDVRWDGPPIEVKWTRYRSGWLQFAEKPTDAEEWQVAVLVVSTDGTFCAGSTFEIVGWIERARFMKVGSRHPKAPYGEPFGVPQITLRPFHELVEMYRPKEIVEEMFT